MIRRIFEAYYAGRASHAASRGKVAKALSYVNSTKEPKYNRATTEALRADLSLVNGNREAAIRSIQLCREYVQEDGECTEFLLSYCDYLEAVMRGDLDDFNRLSCLLRSLPKCFAKDVLKVVKPATKKDLAALPIDRAASRSMH